MSLRTRLTIVVTVIVALTVAAGASAAWLSTRRELRGEVDRFLLERVHPVQRVAGIADRPLGGRRPSGLGAAARLIDFDAVTQVLDGFGRPRQTVQGQPALPIEEGDIRLAASHSIATELRDITIDGEPFRLLTAALPGGGAIQLGRSLGETDDVLDGLRNRLLLAAVVGAAFAALVAWELARRLVRPIAELTATAEEIAATQDLAVPIPVRSEDEVGRLAASFNTMLVALGTSREQQKRLVSDASHELRTPLTAVRTNIDLLARADDLEAGQRQELLDETRLELEELTVLVGELVDLATDARAEEPVGPVDLGEVAEEVAARFRRRTDRSITVELGGEDRVVDGRRGVLDRAISNLVDNAVKFAPGDAPVEVLVEGHRVTVLDRGPGIAEEDRIRVFDRFYRAPATRTLPGSGLGLAIVQQAAELHGGTARLEPRPGGGTAATLTLP